MKILNNDFHENHTFIIKVIYEPNFDLNFL